MNDNDSAVEERQQLMAMHKDIRPEKDHNWGNMLVRPKAGESLLSWLFRQAWSFGIAPKRLILAEKEYWLAKENISLVFPWRWLVTVDVLPVLPVWEHILRERGLNVGVNELQLDISQWFDLTKEPKPSKNKLKNYHHYRLRYCPMC